MINIAVLGHGVVGSGVVEVVDQHQQSIAKKAKEEICVKRILDIRDFDNLPYSNKFTKNFDDILNDESIKIVAEVMGGINPAYDYVKALLEKGKSVVSSNKELVAAKGQELLKIAEDNNVNFLFEASVGGGIPILRPIVQCLAANDLYEVLGILNGTTNFVLTKMAKENMSFDDALKLAQQLGYAERDPSADVDGHDACRKICILAAISFGKHVYPDQVKTEGIRNITLADKEYADIFGGVIKLIGRAKLLEDGKITADVYPAIIAKENQLSSVDDVFNAIMVRGDAIGDVMFYGRGAGKMPTASAVVADIIDCVKHLSARKYLSWDEGYSEYVVPTTVNSAKFFVCVKAEDGLKEKIDAAFKDVKYLQRNGGENEIAFVTATENEGELLNKIEALKATVISKLHIIY